MKKRYKVFFALSLLIIMTLLSVIIVWPIYKNYKIKEENIAIKKYGVSARTYFYWNGANGTKNYLCNQMNLNNFVFYGSDHTLFAFFKKNEIISMGFEKKQRYKDFSVEYFINIGNKTYGDYDIYYKQKDFMYYYQSEYTKKSSSKTMEIDILKVEDSEKKYHSTMRDEQKIVIDLNTNKIIDGTNATLTENYNSGKYDSIIKDLVTDAESQIK